MQKRIPHMFALQYHIEYSYMIRSEWNHHQGIKQNNAA